MTSGRCWCARARRAPAHDGHVSEGGNGYANALRETLRTTAAAYGYALSIATTVTILTTVHGKPGSGPLYLFIAGALVAFAALESVLLVLGGRGEDSDAGGQAFPFAGVLNCFSVPAALAASIGVAHAVHGELAWLIAPCVATAIYLLVVALQVEAVTAFRRRSRN